MPIHHCLAPRSRSHTVTSYLSGIAKSIRYSAQHITMNTTIVITFLLSNTSGPAMLCVGYVRECVLEDERSPFVVGYLCVSPQTQHRFQSNFLARPKLGLDYFKIQNRAVTLMPCALPRSHDTHRRKNGRIVFQYKDR